MASLNRVTAVRRERCLIRRSLGAAFYILAPPDVPSRVAVFAANSAAQRGSDREAGRDGAAIHTCTPSPPTLSGVVSSHIPPPILDQPAMVLCAHLSTTYPGA